MARGPGKAKKQEFEDVPPEFKELIFNASDEEIKKAISTVAINQTELMLAKKADQALEEAKEVYNSAGALYRDGTKLNRMKIEFSHHVLASRGKA